MVLLSQVIQPIMETPTEAPLEPRTPQNEDFEQERTVGEQQSYSHYVRQSVVVLTFRLLTLQALVICAHLGVYVASIMGSPGDITGFVLLATIAIQLANLIVSVYISLNWIKTVYIIRPESITQHRGIAFSTEDEYSTARVESVNVSQSLWGRIFNYGTIHIFNPVLKDDLNITDIPNPYAYAHLISKRKEKDNVRFIPHREDIHHH